MRSRARRVIVALERQNGAGRRTGGTIPGQADIKGKAGALAAGFAIVAVAVAPMAASAANRYVDDTIPGGTDAGPNPCTAIATPCKTIPHAIGQAAAGDEILVGGGSYGPFTLGKAVGVRARDFAGVDTNLPAILSSGVSTVVTITDPGAVLNGFTIRRDMGSPTLSLEAGATVSNNTFDEPVPPAGSEIDILVPFGPGSPTIARNTFADPAPASTTQYGVFSGASGSPAISANEFSGMAIGVHTGNGSAAISGNVFTGTENGIGTGFAIDVQNATATISGNLISDPDPAESAGAIAVQEGGGVAQTGATLSRNRIFGGLVGILLDDTELPVSIEGDVVAKTTGSSNGAITVQNNDPATPMGPVTITNVTVAENLGGSPSVRIHDTSATIDSSLLAAPSIWTQNGGTCTVTHSNGPAGQCGTMQSSVDPVFADPAASDYHLVASDPANAALIEQGNPAASSALDLDGEPRGLDFDRDCTARRDLGADEVTPLLPEPDCTPPAPPGGTADTTAPETTIGSGPKRKTKRRRARLEFSSSEPGSSFECSLDRKPFAACASPLKLKVKRRKHRFEVRAIDSAGNADQTPASRKWKVRKRNQAPGEGRRRLDPRARGAVGRAHTRISGWAPDAKPRWGLDSRPHAPMAPKSTGGRSPKERP